MHIYKNISKLCVYAVLVSSFGCQTDFSTNTSKNITPNVIKTDNVKNQVLDNLQNLNIKDWTSKRILNNKKIFNTKSASDNLKIDNAIDIFPQSTDNKYLVDPAKLISGNNTSLSGRLTTDGTTDEVTGVLTYINQDASKSELKVSDKVLVLSTGQTLTVKEILPERYIIGFEKGFEFNKEYIDNGGSTNDIIAKDTPFTSISEKDGNISGTFYKELKTGDKTAEIIITSDNKTLEKELIPNQTAYPLLAIKAEDAVIAPQKFIADKIATKTTQSAFKIVLAGNSRAKSFNATSSAPAIELNNPTVSSDDILYYTTDNTVGSNFFATNIDGNVIWENEFAGDFQGAAPTFSKPTDSAVQSKLITTKTYLNKRIMYVATKSGEIVCLNTDGRIVAQIKIDDSFKNSVWVDADDQNVDYVYAASINGNFYRLKLDFSNTQTPIFSSVYSTKLANTSFYSSPVMNGASIYVGGEDGVFYEVIPNTGDSSRNWDLSKYPMNGSAKIVGMPAFVNDTMVVPAGGYLFRIVGSTVTQSPLLELKQGLASRIKPYGSVFQGNYKPSGNIISSPVISQINGKNYAYITNGNTIFESDIDSVDNFKNYSTYCLSISGRLDDSDNNLVPYGNGSLDISPSSSGLRASMIDVNTVTNNSPYLNFFSIPLNSSIDTISGYMPLNEFDSKGHSISGYGSAVTADGKGSVYLTLDNGAVNIVPAR